MMAPVDPYDTFLPAGTPAEGPAIWPVPGRYGTHLAWAGPGCRLLLHDGGKPGLLGGVRGYLSAPLSTQADASAAALAWLAANAELGYCAAWPDGTRAHLRTFAEVQAEPRLVVVPCPEHEPPRDIIIIVTEE
jgi:hypothetical protein